MSSGSAASRALQNMLVAQRERAVLWLAPTMVAGAAAWLSAPVDPPPWLAAISLAIAVAGLLFVRRFWASVVALDWLRSAVQAALLLVLAAALGAGAAQVRTNVVAQPAYRAGAGPVVIHGWVIANNANESGPRLRLLVHSIEGVEHAPRYVRLAVSEAGVLAPGRGARCYGELAPPAGPCVGRSRKSQPSARFWFSPATS